MSKATLIEYWRNLILSDEALQDHIADRGRSIDKHDLSPDERRGLMTSDYAMMYRRGVPQELLFQGILLLGINPLQYIFDLQNGVEYRGRGRLSAQDVAAGTDGVWTPLS